MSLVGLGSRNQKTFRPKKSASSGSKGAQLQRHIDAILGSGNLRAAVRLPPGSRFLQSSEHSLWKSYRVLYSIKLSKNVSRIKMGRWSYNKEGIEVSAPKYVEYLMDWIETQLGDESIFPQKLGTPFPPNFRDVKTIFKRLFRVYAHIYHSHFQKIASLKEEAHLNTCFKHFVLLTWEFLLIEKGELAPLYDLIESILSC